MVTTSIHRATARRLRQNTTPHEQALWRALKTLPLMGSHFRPQAPIGPYVVDFLCPAIRLVIELDGGHHADAETAARDEVRQRWLEGEGYRVLRFWNSDINENLSGVLERIHLEFRGASLSKDSRLKHKRRGRSPSPRPDRFAVDPPPPGEGKGNRTGVDDDGIAAKVRR
jgi:very-short-patch-repair endonuclease